MTVCICVCPFLSFGFNLNTFPSYVLEWYVLMVVNGYLMIWSTQSQLLCLNSPSKHQDRTVSSSLPLFHIWVYSLSIFCNFSIQRFWLAPNFVFISPFCWCQMILKLRYISEATQKAPRFVLFFPPTSFLFFFSFFQLTIFA